MKKFLYSVNSFFSYESFRILSIQNVFKGAISVFFQTLKEATINRDCFCYSSVGLALFGNPNYFEKYFDYVKSLTGEKCDLKISNKSITIKGHFFLKAITILICSTTFFLVIIFMPFLFSFKSKRKELKNLILIPKVLQELIFLIKILKSTKTQKIYIFSSYEVEYNLLAIILGFFNITVSKVVSANPLKNYYKLCISDELICTAPYHKEEIELENFNWFVKTIKFWPLQNYLELKTEETLDYKFGFLSSGTWMRVLKGETDRGSGEFETEYSLLKYFNSNNLTSELAIYLHPIERSSAKVFDEAKRFYSKILPNCQLHFFPYDIPSYKNFSKVDLCISGYSSSSIERLFLGYKTILAPIEVKDRFFDGFKLENVVAYSLLELTSLIKENSFLSDNEFFEKNDLLDYRGKNIVQNLN